MRVLVTGGSGFLGGAIIKLLMKSGHEVHGLARSEASARAITQLGAHVIHGDLRDLCSRRISVRASEVLVHAANPARNWGAWFEYERDISIVATRLYQAAREQAMSRFIYISSESVLMDGSPLLDISEKHPYPEKPLSMDGRAKMLAEQQLRGYECGPDVIIIRPSFLWGKGMNSLAGLAADAASGRFAWIDGGRAIIERSHVANVAYAVYLAMTKGKRGAVFNVTDGQAAPCRDILAGLLETVNVAAPLASLPASAARAFAAGCEFAWRVLPLTAQPPLTSSAVAFQTIPRRYSLDAAHSELGYWPVVSVANGLEEMRRRDKAEGASAFDLY